jgi:hypothetical protein
MGDRERIGTDRLRAGILLAIGASAACSRSPDPARPASNDPSASASTSSGPSASTSSGPPASTTASAAPPARAGRVVRPVGSVPSWPPGADGGASRALAACGLTFRIWPPGRTGGPYFGDACYAPTDKAPCLALDHASLPRALGGQTTMAECLESGPTEHADPASGARWCCYSLGFMGEGRPFVVEHRRRAAPLSRSARWTR